LSQLSLNKLDPAVWDASVNLKDYNSNCTWTLLPYLVSTLESDQLALSML